MNLSDFEITTHSGLYVSKEPAAVNTGPGMKNFSIKMALEVASSNGLPSAKPAMSLHTVRGTIYERHAFTAWRIPAYFITAAE